jgi:hypothetical protein
MKRLLLVVAVMAVMVMLLAATAMPAMATKVPPNETGSCGAKGGPPTGFFGSTFQSFGEGDKDNGSVLHLCSNEPNNQK